LEEGTTIAFDRSGHGPPVVLMTAAPGGRSGNAWLAELLAPRFTLLNYNRGGRGRER
jgi:hypothetical protein